MTFQELLNKATLLFPGVLLEKYISHRMRKRILFWLMTLLAVLFVLLILSTSLGGVTGLDVYLFNIRGAFFLVFSAWLVFYLLEAMYFSFYFREDSPMDFEVAKIVLTSEENDITKSFLQSDVGSLTMLRLGILPKDLHSFFEKRKSNVTAGEYYVIENDDDPYITISEYARSIIHFDADFAEFLKRYSIDANTFKGAIDWVARNQKRVKNIEAWWHKDRLLRLPSIGRDWAYGQVYYLEKFGHPISHEAAYQNMDQRSRLYEEEVKNIERILLKGSGANVMLVSGESAQSMNVVAALGKEISKGTVHHDLEGRRLFVMDGTSIIDSMEEKISFEKQLNRIFVQAANAGNVVMVIPDLPSFVASANAIDVNVPDLLKNALDSQRLNVIAISNSQGFHETVETNHDLMRNFEKMVLPELDSSAALELVEGEALVVEARHPVIFTHQSLEAAVESAGRYFSESSLAEKAVDLLYEVASLVSSNGKKIVRRSDIDDLVEKRTGISQGKIKEEEQDQLQNLESLLHERIIGQDLAINSIANAMRRSRAGLNNPKRPMASFLFLGPTGVGKTETTKALAKTFFDSEDKIIRIDMSEYNSDDALSKLIGSFDTKQSGFLASKLREDQYGVLLLDEFEKASKKVHDVFLQILDEGFFTDGRGEKINVRNMIIIATSNAGSDIIYEATKSGNDISDKTQDIVDKIIGRGIFRPELLNRFDSVITFHTLTKDHLKEVAKLMINSLDSRLSNKGLKVKPTEELINYLVEAGSDQKFGARSMNRAIQDEVEKVIADGLIGGQIKEGDDVTLIPGQQGLTLG